MNCEKKYEFIFCWCVWGKMVVVIRVVFETKTGRHVVGVGHLFVEMCGTLSNMIEDCYQSINGNGSGNGRHATDGVIELEISGRFAIHDRWKTLPAFADAEESDGRVWFDVERDDIEVLNVFAGVGTDVGGAMSSERDRCQCGAVAWVEGSRV